eukprot:PRCOL_00004808-RA
MAAAARARRAAPAGAKKGFGKAPRRRAGARPAPRAPPKGRSTVPDLAAAEAAREGQEASTRLIARMLEAGPNAAAVVREHIDEVDERFLTMLDMYTKMAEKDGEPEVVGRLRQLLQVIFEEKQKTLRPEIRLLNELLQAKDTNERELALGAAPDALTSDDGYFFGLVDRMRGDVSAQRTNPQRERTVKLLDEIRSMAKRALKRRAAAAGAQ